MGKRHRPAIQSTFTCAFCGRQPPEVKRSDEHVLKNSLKYLTTPGSGMRSMSSYRDPATGQTRIEYWENGDKNGYQATVEICITCNTKILNNKIEKPFEAVFKEMREGRAVTLNADSVKHMATWAAKTAMTKELLDKEGRRGDLSIPEWQYRWLHDHVSPPNAMLMFFGKVENTPNGYHHHHRFRLSLDVPESAGHVTTFVVGQFWVVVVGFAHEDMFDAFKDGFDEFYSQSHLRSLTRFWPPDTDEVGFQNPPAPQVFPPGPEATFTLCEAVRNGPKKMSATVDGVKINVQSSPQALPSEGPINVTINGQRKNVQLVKGRPPGSLGQGHPDDMMMFIQD